MGRAASLAGIALLLSCSAERNNAISRTWHTFVSYFNGYYHAEQRFRLAQREIELATPEPTEGFIRVFPLIEPSVARSQYARLEEATKKCEVIIFRHKNGRYIDDCRSLIGKCWLLRSNLPNAELNFSYVLSAFPNTPLKPHIFWWQSYLALHDENPYRAESRLTEALSLPSKAIKDCKPQMEALLAQTLIAKGQPEIAIPFLERSAKKLDTRLRRARAFFLLGQLYAHVNKPALAEEYFRKAYKINVTNALTFQSQFQLSLLRGARDPRLIRRLERMAQSSRYEDYRDQIYYRIGQIYAEKGQYEAALRAYKQAGSAGQSPARALAHYEAGTLYFEKFHNISAAQKHFDTAAALIQERHPKAAEIKAVQARFQEYARLRAQIYRLDSVLLLAEMSAEQQERIIEAYIQAEVSRRAAEKARQAQEQQASPSPPNPFLQQSGIGGSSRASGFYFDSPVQISNGRQEFLRLWGERPDEDHWRRRNKGTLLPASRTETSPIATKKDSTEIQWPDDLAELTPQKVEKLKKQIWATIPRSVGQKKALEDTLIGSVLSLAQLYVEAFGRADSAKSLYVWLLHRLPHRTEAQVPALYGLYALAIGSPEAETYKKELLEKYPDSEYARFLRQGGKLTSTNAPESDIHEALLRSYQHEEYLTVIAFGEATRERWQGTESEPAILYLIAAAYVHVGEAEKAIPILREVIQKHRQAPPSSLAQKLLQRLEKGQTALVAESQPGPTPLSEPTSSSITGFMTQARAGEPILVALLVPKEKIVSDVLKQRLAQAHQKYFGDQRLSLVVFLYNNSHHLAYVAQFPDYRSAEAYIRTIEEEEWYKELGLKFPQDFFPISQSNFRTAFTQKRMHDYAAFFAQNRSAFR
ncbi:MAG: tetratricopeptide repeat protein [Bacteroidia bacterium]|nr:tetratricopeptide repeat protein [Bacteroidia bacterium]MDW8134306.1 tetratricopeptide repeat protein [Bacteroidia bacterium]